MRGVGIFIISFLFCFMVLPILYAYFVAYMEGRMFDKVNSQSSAPTAKVVK